MHWCYKTTLQREHVIPSATGGSTHAPRRLHTDGAATLCGCTVNVDVRRVSNEMVQASAASYMASSVAMQEVNHVAEPHVGMVSPDLADGE